MRKFLKKLNYALHPNWHLHLLILALFLWCLWGAV